MRDIRLGQNDTDCGAMRLRTRHGAGTGAVLCTLSLSYKSRTFVIKRVHVAAESTFSHVRQSTSHMTGGNARVPGAIGRGSRP